MATWLEQVNAYRALANLPAVTEDPALSQADRNLAEYEARNLSQLTHSLPPNNPNSIAAQNSNLAGSTDPNYSDAQAIQAWMNGVFHGIGLIDPRLKTVGFGSYRTTESTPYFKMVAALNNLQGLDFNATPQYPIMWPANGKTTSLTTYDRGEAPDARSQCGYVQPAGQPIFLLLGQGNVTGSVTNSLKLNGTPVPICEMDGTNYTANPSQSAWQGIARSILDTRGAVVLLPRDPLANGTYTVEITVNGKPYNWSFTVGTATAPISLSYTGPTNIVAGQAVQGQWTATGGRGGPYTFATTIPLPGGLSLSRDGILNGRARGSGIYSYAAQGFTTATDSAGQTSSQIQWSIFVSPAQIVVTPTYLPDAVEGQPYSVQLSASGGVAPYTFPDTDFGNGLFLNSNGLVSGTPRPGTGQTAFNYSVLYITDANGSAAQFGVSAFIHSAQSSVPSGPAL
jgi:hypothetical protein